jgi:uncharacterized protein YhdP
MPQPIGKSKKQKKTIRIISNLDNNKSQQLTIDYAKVITAALQFTNSKKSGAQLERGSLLFGGGETQLPKEKQLALSGKLSQLDLNPWLNYFKSEA